MEWRSAKASRVLSALIHAGWHIKRQKGSHRILGKAGWPDVTFAFNDSEELGPRMLSRVAKHTDLTPNDL
jgi:predicted RNA binding protein YcfA (HicA-like mRNA interferase family)